jgi:hypothetical protein
VKENVMKKLLIAMMMLVAVSATLVGCKASVDDDGAELKVGDK